MSIDHPNFYENLKEAHMRLLRTIVAYDDQPYSVLAITSHLPDGIFRIYLSPINIQSPDFGQVIDVSNFNPEDAGLGKFIDGELEKKPKSGVLRKQMNSPKFNKYRPFPLGMCNYNSRTYYLERQPQRKVEQGLIRQAISETRITLTKDSPKGSNASVEMYSPAFHDCVTGTHPSPEKCLAALKDPTVENEAAAFHRTFALARGPIGMLFLAYKQNIVGVLPRGDFSELRLGKNYGHTKEVVGELGLFRNIITS